MTTKGEWKVYTGSDEQIAELKNCKHGYSLRFTSGMEISDKDKNYTFQTRVPITHYLICNPHPLADMICQQARTGQPVWVRMTERSYWINNLGDYEGKQQKDGDMNKITNSGNYISYANGRSSSCPEGIVFSSANSDSLSSITRNNVLYSFTPFEDTSCKE